MAINKEGYSFIFIAILAIALSSSYDLHMVTYALLVFIGFLTIFFRDPHRKIPGGRNIVVSPADGVVKSIDNFGAYKEIRIFIRPLDVHINRAPVSGVVSRISRKKGKHKMAFRKSATLNEENVIRIKSGRRRITVVQVVGFMARRIRCWISKNERIEIGQKIGMLIFGSGTNLILPKTAKILVRKKQKVRAGETIVARLG